MVRVYGKPNCKLCDSAKDKLNRLGIEYAVHDIEKLNEEWDAGDHVYPPEVMSVYQMVDTLPIVTIEGVAMTYPKAMKELKRRDRSGSD